MRQQQMAFENIVGKEEIDRNEQFPLFPQCFLLNQITVVPHFSTFLTFYLYLLLNWKSPKLAYGTCVIAVQKSYKLHVMYKSCITKFSLPQVFVTVVDNVALTHSITTS